MCTNNANIKLLRTFAHLCVQFNCGGVILYSVYSIRRLKLKTEILEAFAMIVVPLGTL